MQYYAYISGLCCLVGWIRSFMSVYTSNNRLYMLIIYIILFRLI
jgi:hypothetical protein